MKAPLYNKKGNKKSEVVLKPEIYGARVNERLLEVVRNAYAGNLRSGTASTKTRKEVRGGGKKPWKQKGTGRARHGSIREPQWRGGGIVFGPHPRSYSVHLPKAIRQKALISALSLRGNQKNVMVLEDVKLETPKTREWVEIIKSLPLDGKRALCIVKDVESKLERASRNCEGIVKVQRASDLNAHHILQREKIVIENDALAIIESRVFSEGASAEKPARATVRKTKAKSGAKKSASKTKKAE